MTAIALIIALLIPDSIQTVIVESSHQLFQKATSMSTSPDGKLFVIDQSSNSFHVVAGNNSIVKTIGGPGWGNDAFDLPSDITSSFLLDILVVDANNRRIQRYDKEFNFVQTYDETIIPQAIGKFQPTACATTMQGEIYVLENDSRRVMVLNARGQFERAFGSFTESKGRLIDPKDITITAENEIAVLDRNAVVLFDRFGNFLRKMNLSSDEAWKSVHSSGRDIVATSLTKIEIINLDTNKKATIFQKSLIGVSVQEPFSDAVIQDSVLVILTQHSLYRCSFLQ